MNEKLSTRWVKYRIVPDKYLGYETQIWRFWLPFWCQLGFANTHMTFDAAYEYAKKHKEGAILI